MSVALYLPHFVAYISATIKIIFFFLSEKRCTLEIVAYSVAAMSLEYFMLSETAVLQLKDLFFQPWAVAVNNNLGFSLIYLYSFFYCIFVLFN